MSQENIAVNNSVVHLDDDDFEASVIQSKQTHSGRFLGRLVSALPHDGSDRRRTG